MRGILLAVVAVCVGLIVVGCPSKAPEPAPDNQAPATNAVATEPAFSSGVQEVDEEAPRFSIQDLQGNTVTREDYTNKVLVLDFWATWCGACVAKLKVYGPILAKYQAKGVELLAVSVDDKPDAPAAWAKKNGFGYRIAMCNEEMQKGYLGDGKSTITIPQVRIIDRDGNLRYKLDASSTEADLELALSKLVGEKVGGDAAMDNAAATDDSPAPATAPRGG
jgi:peroxiredoxin